MHFKGCWRDSIFARCVKASWRISGVLRQLSQISASAALDHGRAGYSGVGHAGGEESNDNEL